MRAAALGCLGDDEGRGESVAAESVATTLPRSFFELTRDLGGDPWALLRQTGIALKTSTETDSGLDYRQLLALLEHAARVLRCPDFGLRLAAAQGTGKSVGPLSLVMKSARTLREALTYCAEHSHASSLAMRATLQRHPDGLLVSIPGEAANLNAQDRRQIVEYGLMLAALSISTATGGRARVRAVAFSHAPAATCEVYRAHFGCSAAFGQTASGFVLADSDLQCPITDADAHVYEMATYFIESRYPRTDAPVVSRVRQLVLETLCQTDCTHGQIAVQLRMHPRTLQRRLREEGTSFAEIKDDVRREAILRLLQTTRMPLKLVAQQLGYADPSVLSRSCYRWFASGPRQLRRRLNVSTVVPSRRLRTSRAMPGNLASV